MGSLPTSAAARFGRCWLISASRRIGGIGCFPAARPLHRSVASRCIAEPARCIIIGGMPAVQSRLRRPVLGVDVGDVTSGANDDSRGRLEGSGWASAWRSLRRRRGGLEAAPSPPPDSQRRPRRARRACATPQKGTDIYQAVEEGFWPFVVLWAAEFGLRDFHFISRTTRGTWHSWHHRLGKVEAWVVRLIRSTGVIDLGLSEMNIHLTKSKSGPEGKGPKCRGDGIVLTHMIDNDLECLWSVIHEGGPEQRASINRNGAVIQYTGVRPVGDRWSDEDKDLLIEIGSWREVVVGALLLLEWALVCEDSPSSLLFFSPPGNSHSSRPITNNNSNALAHGRLQSTSTCRAGTSGTSWCSSGRLAAPRRQA